MIADVSELNQLAASLGSVARTAPAELRPVVQKGALNVKREAQQFATGMGHAPHYPRSITYDTKETASGAVAEIGPDKGRTQGALGNILEYGTSKNGPIPHLGPALDREGPRFIEQIEKIAARVLE